MMLCGRRAVTVALSAALAFRSPSIAPALEGVEDPYSHFSFGAPPPIEREVTYDELVSSIRSGTVANLQIAVQHDCVVATTVNGHRWSCVMQDEEVPFLVMESGVELVPYDAGKGTIREVAMRTLPLLLVQWIANDVTR